MNSKLQANTNGDDGNDLQQKLTLEQLKSEAQEVSNRNNGILNALEQEFKDFGLHTHKYRADNGKGHKGLSGHYGRLHVFTGGEKDEYAKYIVFSFDAETGLQEEVRCGAHDYIEKRFSNDKPLFNNWAEGKKFAMKKAAKYDCIDILDEHGLRMNDDAYQKRFPSN